MVAYTYMLGDFASSTHCQRIRAGSDELDYYVYYGGVKSKNPKFVDPRDYLKAGLAKKEDTAVSHFEAMQAFPSTGPANSKDELSSLLMASNSAEHVSTTDSFFSGEMICSDSIPFSPKGAGGAQFEFVPTDVDRDRGYDNPGTSSWLFSLDEALRGGSHSVRGETATNSVLRYFKEAPITFAPPYNSAMEPTAPTDATLWAYAKEGLLGASGAKPTDVGAQYWPPKGYANRIIAKCVDPRPLFKQLLNDDKTKKTKLDGSLDRELQAKPYGKPCDDNRLESYSPIDVLSTYRKPLLLKSITKLKIASKEEKVVS